ncbi:hypothetical protein [Caviibacter abscessus]|uniref:hypothetical protein n=1 Tax=Caviibacter abscessus TaxID=1766719 RepID=UPI00082DA19A|nr:hypothetical protein [Caviibacter abscessus]
MRKIILGLMTLGCIITMSYEFEANLKIGYDFLRADTNFGIFPNSINGNKTKPQIIEKVEVIEKI